MASEKEPECVYCDSRVKEDEAVPGPHGHVAHESCSEEEKESTKKDHNQKRRFEYEMVSYGEPVLFDSDPDYESLEDAIEDYAERGWRFVESGERTAVFERSVKQ